MTILFYDGHRVEDVHSLMENANNGGIAVCFVLMVLMSRVEPRNRKNMVDLRRQQSSEKSKKQLVGYFPNHLLGHAERNRRWTTPGSMAIKDRVTALTRS